MPGEVLDGSMVKVFFIRVKVITQPVFKTVQYKVNFSICNYT